METGLEENSPNFKQRCVLVCQYRSCLENNSAEVLAAFEAVEVPGVTVTGAECQGQCSSGPTVRILPDETWYYRVKPDDVPVIVEQHLKNGQPVEKMLNPRIHLRFSF